MAKISVIIPAYRRFPLTIRHIEEAMKANRPPDEIVVINDGGDPSLLGLVREITCRICPIVYARVEEDILWNYNGAVNLGAWLSSGDILAIEDCDHVPDRDSYEAGETMLIKHPEAGRVAFSRKVVDVQEVLAKPMAEWTALRTWGSNVMVSMLRRETYIDLKGQDERFARNYGFMGYDWPSRLNKYGVKTVKTKWYWAVVGDEGEPGLKRGLSSVNRGYYKENAVAKTHQHPKGILNFTWTVERMYP